MNRIFAPDGHGDPRGQFQMAPQIRWPFEEVGIDLGFLSRGTESATGTRWAG
jgi:hypothetical protein